jgi:CubicO group peptidase (beta-lactamase class C family)
MKYLLLLTTIFSILSCKKSTDNVVIPDPIPVPSTEYYFPALTGDIWDTKTTASVGWDDTKLTEAFDFASTKNTFGLIVLHHGKIVKEQYWNNWNTTTKYPLNSAGKSVVGFVAGISQQEGTININNKSSQYLGVGWTSLPLVKENLITLRHQLTMTTGLDDGVANPDSTAPANLVYKADAGTRWAYHNAPYRLMQNVMASASGKTWNAYCKEKLFDKVGMANSLWFNNIMYCTTRDAARFGSLILNKGKWNGTLLLTDDAYFTAMTNTSQNYNLSYGYLWWLNGKASTMVPGLQTIFPVPLASNAPADMLMALGKDDKKIYVIPSLDVVVVRLGDNAGPTPVLGPSSFDNDLWGKLKLAMRY